jgi:hypothetical protein
VALAADPIDDAEYKGHNHHALVTFKINAEGSDNLHAKRHCCL